LAKPGKFGAGEETPFANGEVADGDVADDHFARFVPRLGRVAGGGIQERQVAFRNIAHRISHVECGKGVQFPWLTAAIVVS